MKYLDTNTTRLAYKEEGQGESLVFLNGILMAMASWKVQLDYFQPHYHCLLHDFRGQLNSGKVFPKNADLSIHIEDLLALLDDRGIDKCHLVGTSYGGEVALLFAQRYPERVRSLCIIASVTYSDALLQRQVQLWRDLAGVDPGLLYDAVATLAYSGTFLEQNGEALAQRRAAFGKLPADFFRGFEQLCDAFLQLDIPPAELVTIPHPTLVIAAGQDILKTPSYSEHMTQHLPNARLEVIPQAGHAVVVEEPAQINRLVHRFLQQLPDL